MVRNIYLNGEKAVIIATLHDKLSTKIQIFAASFSGVFAEVEAPGDESEKH